MSKKAADFVVAPEQVKKLRDYLKYLDIPAEEQTTINSLLALNENMCDIMKSNQKLRLTLLKSMGILASSERLTSKSSPGKAILTAADLHGIGRRYAERAFYQKMRAHFYYELARRLETANIKLPNTSGGHKEPRAEDVKKEEPKMDLEMLCTMKTGEALAYMAYEEFMELTKIGALQCMEKFIDTSDPLSIRDEVLEVGRIFDAHEESFPKLREEMVAENTNSGTFSPVPAAHLFGANKGVLQHETARFSVPPELLTPGTRKSEETSLRIDCTMVATQIKVVREVCYNPETGVRHVAQQTLGPVGSQLTWNTMVTVAVYAVEYCLPIHRIALMLSNENLVFSRTRLWDVVCYAAEACLEPWLNMVVEAATTSPLFYGDDTETATREYKRNSKKEDENTEGESTSEKKMDSNTPEKRKRFDDSALDRIHEILMRTQTKKDGKAKTRSQTSVLIGQGENASPKEWRVIYYTHMGSFGDFLEQILAIRSTKVDAAVAAEITVVCDASSANKPKNYHGFEVRFGGCSMHARRKFFLIDPEKRSFNVRAILTHFSFIYAVEAWLTRKGRTAGRVLRLRARWAAWAWQNIFEACENILNTEPPTSEEAKAAKYVLKHYEELTNYIALPHSSLDNGTSERCIRPIRIQQNANNGQETERGRLAGDVLRSMAATCRAIGISFKEYLLWVLVEHEKIEKKFPIASGQLPPSELKQKQANLGTLTPHAFLKMQAKVKDANPQEPS